MICDFGSLEVRERNGQMESVDDDGHVWASWPLGYHTHPDETEEDRRVMDKFTSAGYKLFLFKGRKFRSEHPPLNVLNSISGSVYALLGRFNEVVCFGEEKPQPNLAWISLARKLASLGIEPGDTLKGEDRRFAQSLLGQK